MAIGLTFLREEMLLVVRLLACQGLMHPLQRELVLYPPIPPQRGNPEPTQNSSTFHFHPSLTHSCVDCNYETLDIPVNKNIQLEYLGPIILIAIITIYYSRGCCF